MAYIFGIMEVLATAVSINAPRQTLSPCAKTVIISPIYSDNFPIRFPYQTISVPIRSIISDHSHRPIAQNCLMISYSNLISSYDAKHLADILKRRHLEALFLSPTEISLFIGGRKMWRKCWENLLSSPKKMGRREDVGFWNWKLFTQIFKGIIAKDNGKEAGKRRRLETWRGERIANNEITR